MIGIAYYLYFQLTGILLIHLLLQREGLFLRLLIGSVCGSLLTTWLPVLFSFFLGFTVPSHLLALVSTLPLWLFALPKFRLHTGRLTISGKYAAFRRHTVFLILLALLLLFWCLLLHTHTLPAGEDGGLYTGQCTYGDMNMHLGFITSLAEQSGFPPDYSIFPGVKLSYPFLSDSISSSLLVLGSSLRTAYIFPMIFAMAQIFSTVYLFSYRLFQSASKARLTLLLFFLNGGFGFTYFLNQAKENGYAFSDIFTGFYMTPTNLLAENIRWVNVIADMFLPQRATLFGYAVLFPALLLLYEAVFQNKRLFFPIAALFASALPMIHTHSFLCMGIVSGVWLLLWLRRRCGSPVQEIRPGTWILVFLPVFMCLVQFLNSQKQITSDKLILLGISIFITAAIYGLYLLFAHLRRFGIHDLLSSWGVYLAIILFLALPQLFYWTFHQVSEGDFVRGWFNWANQGDFYLWFYVKNLGLALLLIVCSISAWRKQSAPLCLAALFLWWLSEFIVFTPNTYDNNKILYVSYFLLCLAAADYGIELYQKVRGIRGIKIITSVFIFCCVFSAVLTLGREVVSNYQLYSPSQTALASYITENTKTDAVFLTDTRHNNEISSLTGRNIVCGSDTFLYYHGLDTTSRRQDVQQMYEYPLESMALFEKYQVSYIVISPFERNSYHIDETALQELSTEVFSFQNTVLYRLK